MVAPEHGYELEGCGGVGDNRGGEGLVVVVPGQRRRGREKGCIVVWVGGGGDVDKTPFGGGGLGIGEGEEEEEGEGQ